MSFLKKGTRGPVDATKEYLKEKIDKKFCKKKVYEHFGVHPKSIFKNKKEVFVGHYVKDDDDFIFEQIKPILKRVTAMLNKQRELLELSRVNKKRVYRVMKIKGLLLPKTETTREHQSTGKVMTLHPNTRWRSDGFEIKCFNGEKVYVAFVLDTCDREVISFVARARPLLSEDIQEIMLNAVEFRFPSGRADRQIEFLSDRIQCSKLCSYTEFEILFYSCVKLRIKWNGRGVGENYKKILRICK